MIQPNRATVSEQLAIIDDLNDEIKLAHVTEAAVLGILRDCGDPEMVSGLWTFQLQRIRNLDALARRINKAFDLPLSENAGNDTAYGDEGDD
jgi:hypothetical protein